MLYSFVSFVFCELQPSKFQITFERASERTTPLHLHFYTAFYLTNGLQFYKVTVAVENRRRSVDGITVVARLKRLLTQQHLPVLSHMATEVYG